MVYKNLIHKFEYTIRELLGADMTEQEIYSLVSLTLNDFLVDGEFTQQYKELAVTALKLKEDIAKQENSAGIVSVNGERIQ